MAQYLFYAGRISWQTMIRAICWQRRQRPVFGELAQEYGYLKSEDLKSVLAERQPGERIGEAAQRTGRLLRHQCLAVLSAQKAREPKIGCYFVQNGLLSRLDLDDALAAQRQHNARARAGAHPEAGRRKQAA